MWLVHRKLYWDYTQSFNLTLKELKRKELHIYKMNSSNIQNRAAEIALNYYRDTPKCALIGKTSQKTECAKAVLEQVPIETLLASTVVRLRSNPRIVFFKYEHLRAKKRHTL
jgi:ABC-type uncharacterized transport system substrate-binding protein